LDELRRLLSRGIGNIKPKNIGEGVGWDMEGSADHLDQLSDDDLKRAGVDVDKLAAARKASSPPRYTTSTDGKDAIIRFGKHKDKSLRDVYAEDPTYLGWLLKEFRERPDKASKDFCDIVKNIIDGGK
jgi:hypothetical protein